MKGGERIRHHAKLWEELWFPKISLQLVERDGNSQLKLQVCESTLERLFSLHDFGKDRGNEARYRWTTAVE